MRRLPWIVLCSVLITVGGAMVVLALGSVLARPSGMSVGAALRRVFGDDPALVVVLVAAYLFVVLLTLFARALGRGPGSHECSRCGYDLSGSAGGVCPECGSTIDRR